MKTIEQTLAQIIETGIPQKINETYVDVFTAKLINTVITSLTENNKKKLLSMPTNELVATAHKVLVYPLKSRKPIV